MNKYTKYEVTFENGGSICERFFDYEKLVKYISEYKENPIFGNYYILKVTHEKIDI